MTTAEATFASLYTTHLEWVRYRAVRGLAYDDADLVDDITQEVFLRLWAHLARGREVTHPRAFLKTLALCTLADHYRRSPAYERAVDFTDARQAARLRAVPAAEDFAVTQMTARELLAVRPKGRSEHARARRVAHLAVAA